MTIDVRTNGSRVRIATKLACVGFAVLALGFDLVFSWLVAGMASAAGPEGAEMAVRLVWAPAMPFLAALVVLVAVAWMDRGWSSIALVAGGVWSGWSGIGSLVAMGGLPGADMLGVLAFALAVAETALAVAAAIFAWVRLAPGRTRP